MQKINVYEVIRQGCCPSLVTKSSNSICEQYDECRHGCPFRNDKSQAISTEQELRKLLDMLDMELTIEQSDEESPDAPIGYKIMVGDYIVMTPSYTALEKAYIVTKVSRKHVVCKVGNGRRDLKFPRYYHLPFLPIQRKNGKYTSTNTWSVRINDTGIKRKLGI